MRCLFFPDFLLHRYYYCPFTEITMMYVPKRVKINLMVKIRLKIIALFTRQVYEIIIRMSDTIGKHLWLLYFEDNFVELIACIPKRPQIWSNPREHPSPTRSKRHFTTTLAVTSYEINAWCVFASRRISTLHMLRVAPRPHDQSNAVFLLFFIFYFYFLWSSWLNLRNSLLGYHCKLVCPKSQNLTSVGINAMLSSWYSDASFFVRNVR